MKIYCTEDEFSENQSVKIMEDTHAVEPEHTHDFVEFVYVQEGDIVHSVDDRYIQVHSGGIVYVDVGQKHFYCSTGKVKFINIALRKTFFDEVCSWFSETMQIPFNAEDVPCAQFEGEEKAYVERIVKTILWEYQGRENRGEVILKEQIKIFIAIFARKLHEQHLDPLKMDIGIGCM